jgi:hypothetical protein
LAVVRAVKVVTVHRLTLKLVVLAAAVDVITAHQDLVLLELLGKETLVEPLQILQEIIHRQVAVVQVL